jgi:hypothetical protein
MKPDALDKLHDFYQPAPPSWMPQTLGWYVVFGVFFLVIAWTAWRMFERWRRNRYRREGTRELDRISAGAIPALLKRTALAAWPREQVASLSGEDWLRFLEAHGGNGGFSKDRGQTLLDLDYRGSSVTPEEERALRQTAGNWIRRHRVRA